MNTLQILRGVRELLSRPSSWTKGQEARNEFGSSVDPMHETATCWCLKGAVIRVAAASDDRWFAMRTLVDYIDPNSRTVTHTLTSWNDNYRRDHFEVLDLLDRVIAREGSKV